MTRKVPDSWRKARVTFGIAALTAAVWLFLYASGSMGIAIWWGLVPERLNMAFGYADGYWLLAEPLSLTLVHFSFIQLAFNLLLLIVCGRIVEPIIGGRGMLILYLVGAYAAAAAHYLAFPHSIAVLVGAGGAVSAVVGAYGILAGRLRMKLSSPVLGRAINIIWIGAAWIGIQGLLALTVPRIVSVPVLAPFTLALGLVACVGGFVAGLLLARPLFLLKWRGA